MLFYAKLTAKKQMDKVDEVVRRLNISFSVVIADESKLQKTPDSIYSKMKNDICERGESLCVDSVFSLGKNCKEIYKELKWFSDNGIHVCIADIPLSFSINAQPMAVLTETFCVMSSAEKENQKAGQREGYIRAKEENRHMGREKIPFPANWDENYRRWKNKEISASEFQMNVGLKKGTFYNLIKQYQRTADIEEQKNA